jgi:hypothetical protein
MADQNLDPKDLRSLGKDVLSTWGDFNDLLKDSIRDISKITNSYNATISKIEGMNKGMINTKKIQNELEKANTKEIEAKKKLADIEKKMSDEDKANASAFMTHQKNVQSQIENLNKILQTGTQAEIDQQEQILRGYEASLDFSKASLRATSAAYVLQQQSTVEAEKLKNEVQERLTNEKNIEKTIGKTGKAIGFLSDKFGIFGNLYSKIVEEGREDNKQTVNKVKIIGGLVGLLKSVGSLIKGVGSSLISGINPFIKSLSSGEGTISGLTRGLSSMVGKFPVIGGFLSGIVDTFSSIADLAIGINDNVIKAGRNLNLNSQQAIALNRHFQDVSRTNGDIFVTSKKLLESQAELGNELEINNILTDEQLAANIKLKDLAGIEASTRASIVENSIISGKTSEGLVKSVFAQVTGLQKLTGISFNYKTILKEANALGGYLGLSFSKYPEKISKALVTTKALGLNLKEVDSLASSFLDFESSISKEFEAQLLTGKDINLQTARQLFLNNDLAGAAAEINKQVGSSSEFLGMNRIAAESLAESFGMSRDSMGEMLKKQEFLSRLGAKDTDNAREQLRLGLEKYHTQEKLVEAIGEEAYQNLLNASSQEKIAALVDKIKNSLIDLIERSGLLDKLTKFIDGLSDPKTLNSIIGKIQSFFSGAVVFFGDILAGITDFAAFFAKFTGNEDKWRNYSKNIRAGAASTAQSINSVGLNMQESVNQKALLENYNTKQTTASNTGNQSNNNQNQQPINITISPKYDGQHEAVAVHTNNQSSAGLDNTGTTIFAPINIGNSGQTV